MATFDHNSYDADEEPDEGPPHIPGLERPAIIPHDYSLPPPPEVLAAQDACYEWDCQADMILMTFPSIGMAGSEANRRFVELFRVFAGVPTDALTLAELVMIYPPKEPLL